MKDEEKPGCLLARLRPSDAAKFCLEIDKLIPDEDVNSAEGGKERDIHVSVLFGFNFGFEPEKLKQFLSKRNPFYFTLGPIGTFKNESVVLWVGVESPQLHDLHEALVEEFGDEIEETHPNYHPHLTLAYLKPGAKAADLEGSTKFEGETYYISELVFSYGTSAYRSAETFKLGTVSESVRSL
jgi:hypothetical protein